MSFIGKVNILQLLTVYVLQFIINDKTLHLLFSLLIGSVEVGPDIDMKFHQVVVKIVRYDTKIKPDPKIRSDTKIKSDSKIRFHTKIKFDPEIRFHWT